MRRQRPRAAPLRALSLLHALLTLVGCSDGGAGAVPVVQSDAAIPAASSSGADAATAADDGGADDGGSATSADASSDASAGDASSGDAARGDASSDAATDASDASMLCDGGPCVDCSKQQELCDGLDNDCDGKVDEDCYVLPFSAQDFDVSDDGRAVAVGFVGQTLKMVCFGADGRVAKAAFDVAQAELPSLKASYADVARADALGNIAVSYSYWNFPGSPNDWRTYAAIYDADCEPVRAGTTLDVDLPNTNVVRQASVQMTEDGRSYFIYENQSQNVYRVLGFDAQATRIAAVTIPSSTECAGGALSRVLALDETSGKFAVICERNSGRIFRRYAADGTPRDSAFQVIPGYPGTVAFHYFSGALAPDGTFLYFGMLNSGEDWIARVYDDDLTLRSVTLPGTSANLNPAAHVTTAGNFLIELTGQDFHLALLSKTGALLEGFPPSYYRFELAGPNQVYSQRDGRIVRENIAIGPR